MSTNYYGKAEQAATRILEAFRAGELPKALAPIFIQRRDGIPCRAWSWANQLLVALHGYGDARGFRQWEAVGRHVQKGQHGFPILVPCTKKFSVTDDATGESADRVALYGFKSAIVFGLQQTAGAELPPADPAALAWIDSLPLVDVARHWGLSVETYNGRAGAALGKYRHGQAIAVGVENLSTWAHELLHAADYHLGNLTEHGQHWRSETVAELGGAVLLEILGHESAADRGGCWEYVSAYARDAKLDPLVACQRALKRTCDAVALILSTAEQLQGADDQAGALDTCQAAEACAA